MTATAHDDNLTKSGEPRCESNVTAQTNWRYETRCSHAAKHTIDGVQLCGVHARSIINRKQYGQHGKLDATKYTTGDASRAYTDRRTGVAEYLLSSVECGSDPVEAFRVAREMIDDAQRIYAIAVGKIIEQIDAALAYNAASEFPLDKSDKSMIDAHARRRRLVELHGELTSN
jgi:hypothetical protein